MMVNWEAHIVGPTRHLYSSICCCQQVKAHSTRGQWLGAPLTLNLKTMEVFDTLVAKKMAAGATEAEALSELLSPGNKPSPELIAAMTHVIKKPQNDIV